MLDRDPAPEGFESRCIYCGRQLTDRGAFTNDAVFRSGAEIVFRFCSKACEKAYMSLTNEHRDEVFCEGGRLHGETHCMELESTRNQVPTGLHWPRLSLQRSEGPEHTKAVMCRTREYKYVRRLYEQDELYDLQADPAELHNRIDDPALAQALAELKERSLTFYLETGDVVPLDTDLRS